MHQFLAYVEILIDDLIDHWGPPASPNSVFVLAPELQDWLVRILVQSVKGARKDVEDIEDLVRQAMESWDRATLRIRYDCQHCRPIPPRPTRKETEIEWFIVNENTSMMAIDNVEWLVREALGQTPEQIEKILSVPHWQRMRPPEVRRSNGEAKATEKAAGITRARAASLFDSFIGGLYGGPLPEDWDQPAKALPEPKGREIERLRKKLSWTQEGTARAAGVSVRTVVRAEQGKVSDETAESILKVLRGEPGAR